MAKSKSSSKSSSKSLVNTIESVLPKGISLIHVLLAIGLGIMICSFLSESVVEGLGVKAGAPCPTKGNKGKTSDPTPKSVICSGPSPYKWTVVSSKPQVGPKWNIRAAAPSPNSGICSAKDDAGKASCLKLLAKKDCTDDQNCEWLDCGKDFDVYGDINGPQYTKLMNCIGNGGDIGDVGGTAKTASSGPWMEGTPESISGLLPINDSTTDSAPVSFNNSFLGKLKCSSSGDGKVNCKTSVLPEGARDHVQELAEKCGKGWGEDKFKDLYTANGGGPIMSFTEHKGLTCLNPLNEQECAPGGIPRLIRGKACPTGKCPCKNETLLKYDENRSDVDTFVDLIVDNTLGDQCKSVKFQQANPKNCFVHSNVTKFWELATDIGGQKLAPVREATDVNVDSCAK